MTTLNQAVGSTTTRARPSVDYSTFVIAYSRAQRTNLLLAFAGVGLIVGAGVYLSGVMLIALVSVGLGVAAAGLGGFGVAAMAHSAYAQHLTATTTTTAEPPAGPSVRAFVPSSNGAPTIRAGRFSLDRSTWVKLFQTANGDGRLTRDKAAAVLPRSLYRSWSQTLEELERLGLVDATGCITQDGRRWFQENVSSSPYPIATYTQSGAHSTRARSAPDAPGSGA